jgi:hypothetical protein
MIAAVFCELLHRVVIGENIAVDTSHQRDRNFQDWHKKVIGGLADLLITHQ